MGISQYPLNNRRFTCLLVPPKGVHSTILISEGTADIEIRELPAGGIVSAEGGV